MNLLDVFYDKIDEEKIRAYFDYLKGGSVVGCMVGFAVGHRAGNSLAGTLLGGLGGVLISAKTGLAGDYAKAKASQFERKERRRLIAMLLCRLPKEGKATNDLQNLETNELYALAYFFGKAPTNLSEQAMLNVLLNQIKEKYPNLFNALKEND